MRDTRLGASRPSSSTRFRIRQKRWPHPPTPASSSSTSARNTRSSSRAGCARRTSTAKSIRTTSTTRSSAHSRRRASSFRAARTASPRATRRARRQAVWTAGRAVLGICYGMQTMAAQLGGTVESGKVREFGYAEVRARGHSALFRGIAGPHQCGRPRPARRVDEPRRQGHRAAAGIHAHRLVGEPAPIAAMADESRRFYAVQFHPEVTHTQQGTALLARFVHDICGCGNDWNMHDYVDEAVASDPRAGRRRRRPAGPVRRRGFVGRGGADPSRHRRPADLRVRRSRPAAAATKPSR